MKKFKSLKWWHKLLLSLILVLATMSIFIIPVSTGIDIITPIFFITIIYMIIRTIRVIKNKVNPKNQRGMQNETRK